LILALVCSIAFAEKEYDPLEKRLIQYGSKEHQKQWVTVEHLEQIDTSRHHFGKLGVGYFDITDFQAPIPTPPIKKFDFPTAPTQQSIVNPLIQQASANNVRNYISTLSGFSSRYYTTSTGAQSAVWLRDFMQDFADAAGRSDCNCSLYAHSGYIQNSVICRISGISDIADEIIVTGAHLDSVNSRSVPNGVAPGADDDATGVASFVETWRILVSSGFRPLRSIEFMAYAAEEVGLRGSQDIARAYRAQGKNVYAVYQNEMSGYVENQATVTVLQDYVDLPLTRFVESLVDEYLSIPYTRAVCGYGCSDHASWDAVDYATICTAEAGPFGDVNPAMHTIDDTLDKLDMNFTIEFARLCLAFVVELSIVR